jgi:polysaccharide export outer membrane protein
MGEALRAGGPLGISGSAPLPRAGAGTSIRDREAKAAMSNKRNIGKTAVQRTILIAIAAFVWFLAPAPVSADAGYRLGAGDKVRVTVFGEADLTGEYEVDGTGVVALPLVGEVKAVGGTARDLEAGIVKKLSQGYLKNPTVAVEVLSYRPFFILGEVKRPGSYPYKNGLNVLNAVALAGGYTYRAKSNVWVITRSGDKEYQEREVQNGDFIVRPGDTIVVPERFF